MMKTTKKTVMMIVIIAIMAIITGCNNNQVPKEPLVYTNPVFSPVLADPGIIEHEGVFYVYGTQDYGMGEMILNMGPILSSPDLVNWTYEGSVFEMDRPTWGGKCGNLGTDVKTTSVCDDSHQKGVTPILVLVATPTPTWPWIDHGMLIRSDMIGVIILSTQPYFWWRPLMIWGSFRGLYGLELTCRRSGIKRWIKCGLILKHALPD